MFSCRPLFLSTKEHEQQRNSNAYTPAASCDRIVYAGYTFRSKRSCYLASNAPHVSTFVVGISAGDRKEVTFNILRLGRIMPILRSEIRKKMLPRARRLACAHANKHARACASTRLSLHTIAADKGFTVILHFASCFLQ